MKELTQKEIDFAALDDYDESQEGYTAVESDTTELSKIKAGTLCGLEGNQCFKDLARPYPKRVVRGWFHKKENVFSGMIHIQCSEDEAERIEEIAGKAGGSLRHNGKSIWHGFQEFENE